MSRRTHWAHCWGWLRRLQQRITLSGHDIALSIGIPGTGLRLTWRRSWRRTRVARRRGRTAQRRRTPP